MTAESVETTYVIERVVLATQIASDGAPANEVSVLSQEQQNVYLAVRVRDMQPDTRFRAMWYENDEVIGQSDIRVDEPDGDVQWVALPFRSIAVLNPAASHAVELIIGDRSINSFVFRVGVGNPSDVIAEATLALGTNDEGEPISPGDEFDRFASQIVLVARISNMVDPTGMIFTSQWSRGNVPLGVRQPDGGQPRLGSGQSEPADRIMTFTLVPEGNLIPGSHTVTIFLNGTPIGSYNFTVSTDDVAAEPEPTATPEPDPVDEPDGVNLVRIAIARDVDEDTSEPQDAITETDGFATELLELYVALELENLTMDDVVEVTTGIGNSVIDRFRLPVAAVESGWMSTPVTLRAPDLLDTRVVYEITVFVNGQRIDQATFVVHATEPAPEPTPTPNPFDPDPTPVPDDDDGDDD